LARAQLLTLGISKMESVLTVRQIHKWYGKVHAVQSLSLNVPEGSVYGILGPNGSGKTTTLGIVLGVIRADSGSYEWLGGNSGPGIRKNIGALLEQPNFYPYLTALQNLRIIADIKGCGYDNLDQALETVNLSQWKNTAYKTFSSGMKQRLAIAATLIGSPRVMVLDEPTNGLDPQGIAEVRELIKDIASQGKTIILASHLLDEVEKVCTHVAVLKKGKLLAEGPVSNALASEEKIEAASDNMSMLQKMLADWLGSDRVQQADGVLLITAGDLDPSEINRKAFESGIVLTHLSIRHKTLESHFLELTTDDE